MLKEFSIERESLALDAENRSFSLLSADAIDKVVRDVSLQRK